MSDLSELEGIGNINDSQAGIEIGHIEKGPADDLPVFRFRKLVRSETPSPGNEVSIGDLESRDQDGILFIAGVKEIQLGPWIFASLGQGFFRDDQDLFRLSALYR